MRLLPRLWVSVRALLYRSGRRARRIHDGRVYLTNRDTTPMEHLGFLGSRRIGRETSSTREGLECVARNWIAAPRPKGLAQHVLALQNPSEIFAEDVELEAYLRADSMKATGPRIDRRHQK